MWFLFLLKKKNRRESKNFVFVCYFCNFIFEKVYVWYRSKKHQNTHIHEHVDEGRYKQIFFRIIIIIIVYKEREEKKNKRSIPYLSYYFLKRKNKTRNI